MNRIVAVIGRVGHRPGLAAGRLHQASPPAWLPPPPKRPPGNAGTRMRESWDVYLMQGKRIGYGYTTVRRGGWKPASRWSRPKTSTIWP